MYKWGYIKDAVFAKIDLDEDEANTLNLISKFKIYANEAMSQICSSVKPKKAFKTFVVSENDLNKVMDFGADDFVSFNDEPVIKVYDDYNLQWRDEAHDEDFLYLGYNQLMFYNVGEYIIGYNARWISFDLTDGGLDDDLILNAPADILDCLPPYIASQCLKIDDEYKSSVFRNEYEIALARLDNTDYKSTKTFRIGGDW